MEYDDPSANAYAKAKLKQSRHGGRQGHGRAGKAPATTIDISAEEEFVAAQSSAPAAPAFVELKENDLFDWESYIAPYKGHTRLVRLLFIAEHCPSLRIACSDEALRLIQETTADVPLYQHALAVRNTQPDGEVLPNVSQHVAQNDAWLKQANARTSAEEEKLELELRNYQNNMIRESIRMANRDLGDFYRSAGHPTQALKYYQQTREYTSTGEHVLEMSLNVIEVGLDQRAYQLVQSNVAKAEGVLQNIISGGEGAALAAGSIHTGGGSGVRGAAATKSKVGPASRGANTAGGDAIGALFRAGGSAGVAPAGGSGNGFGSGSGSGGGSGGSREAKAKKLVREIQDKLNVAGGIASMGLHRYSAALRSFSKVDMNSSESWSHMASPADIALYTSFCATATLERAELRRRLVGRGGPQSSAAEEASNLASNNAEGGTTTGGGIMGTLDVDPAARELIWKFHECDFQHVFRNLDVWRSRHLLDFHLSPHVEQLSKIIRTRCVRDFLKPYQSLAIADMAAAFGFDEPALLRMLVALSEEDQISVRIDMISKTLTAAPRKDERAELYERAFRVSAQRVKDYKSVLFHQELVREKLIVKDSKHDGW